jgi:hypothetical protein
LETSTRHNSAADCAVLGLTGVLGFASCGLFFLLCGSFLRAGACVAHLFIMFVCLHTFLIATFVRTTTICINIDGIKTKNW